MDKGPQFVSEEGDRLPNLYHGTTSDLGGKLVPADEHGGTALSGDYGADVGQPSHAFAFSTPEEDVAWHYADRAYQYHGSGRGYVAALKPDGPFKRGAFWGVGHPEYVSPSYTVTDRIDVKPGHQATIAPVDWNKYKKDGPADPVDANHVPAHRVMPAPPKERTWHDSVTHEDQIDLFSGLTARQHADSYAEGNHLGGHDGLMPAHEVGRYHDRAAYGYDQPESMRDLNAVRRYRQDRIAGRLGGASNSNMNQGFSDGRPGDEDDVEVDDNLGFDPDTDFDHPSAWRKGN